MQNKSSSKKKKKGAALTITPINSKQDTSIVKSTDQLSPILLPLDAVDDFPIVGVGASAGGLEALEMFFGNLPVASGAAFVVIQHLSPNFKSFMPEILQRSSGMKIHFAEDNMAVFPNCIYVLPPRKNLLIHGGHFRLQEIQRSNAPNRPIDLFFTSLAHYRTEGAIGVILSGTGSDGTEGIRAIHDLGGQVLVQEPGTAKFDGMPRSAISTNYVDIIAPPDVLAEKLIQLWNNHSRHQGEDGSDSHLLFADGKYPETDLQKIFKILEKKYDVDFSLYKSPTIMRRVVKQMEVNRCTNISKFLEILQERPQSVTDLYHDMLIGVTKFFRDTEAFEFLETQIIPQIMHQKSEDEEIRIWIAGTASGEEAYSIAILFLEYQRIRDKNYKLKIIATDIDEIAIGVANEGLYNPSAVDKMRPNLLAQYFTQKGNNYLVNQEVRKTILFARHNLLKDPPFTKIDLISCRNLLIYFGEEAQNNAMGYLYFALKSAGTLFLGPSETIGKFEKGYQIINAKWKFFQKLNDTELFSNVALNFPRQDFSRSTVTVPQRWFQKGIAMENLLHNDLKASFEFLLHRYVPAGILVNEDLEFFHIFGDAGKYLQNRPGPAKNNLKNMIGNQVILTIFLTIQRVKKENKGLYNITVKDESSGQQLILGLEQLTLTHQNATTYYLITFQDALPPSEASVNNHFGNGIPLNQTIDHDGFTEKIQTLEREIKTSKENLQAIIEELETTNEELQSTNEELMAANEELQSTNEELHSVNEELYTVNTEYQNKIDELTQMANDEENFLKSTDIGTIFLSKDLTIRKFTPVVAKSFNLLPQDIGRPITHITHNLVNVDLISIVLNVLQTKHKESFEVQSTTSNWFLVKALPYQTFEGNVEGVILTFTDIDAIKQAEIVVADQQQLARALIDNVPALNYVTDSTGKITFASKSFLDFSALTLDGQINDQWILKIDPSHRKKFKMVISDACTKHQSFHLQYRQKRFDGDYRKIINMANPLFSDQQVFIGIVGSCLDITDNCDDCWKTRPNDC